MKKEQLVVIAIVLNVKTYIYISLSHDIPFGLFNYESTQFLIFIYANPDLLASNYLNMINEFI
jgi:hypothetical protein